MNICESFNDLSIIDIVVCVYITRTYSEPEHIYDIRIEIIKVCSLKLINTHVNVTQKL